VWLSHDGWRIDIRSAGHLFGNIAEARDALAARRGRNYETDNVRVEYDDELTQAVYETGPPFDLG